MLCIIPNTLKITLTDFTDLMQRQGIVIRPVEWYEIAYWADTTKDILTHLPEFGEGWFYLQNASSLVPVIALDPQPDEKILDLAAAPGGKTIHTAIKMRNTGTILANDISSGRIARMKRLFTSYAVTLAQTTCIPGQRLWMKYPDVFDRVLLDAPCSMQGTDDPSTDDPKKMARTQKWLLRSALSACKIGGTLVYSTCTTTTVENEEVIDWLLQKDARKVRVEPIELNSHLTTIIGHTHLTDRQLHPDVQHCVRIERSPVMEGFFIAKLRRVA